MCYDASEPSQDNNDVRRQEEPVPDAAVNALQELAALYRFIRSCPDRWRSVLRLKAMQGGYSREAADLMWVAVNVVGLVEADTEGLHQDAQRN